MPGNNSTHKKRIGSIGKPDDEALPAIEYLKRPKEDGRREATAVFENGSELRFREDSDGNIHEETYFSSGRMCESFTVNRGKPPSEHLKHVLEDYSTISKDDLRTSRPGLWPILEVECDVHHVALLRA